MSVSKSFNHLSAKEVEKKASMKQGIVTILGSDCERSKAASIRRTLSADMSSRKWLAQNEFCSPVKKIGSSEELVIIPDCDSSSSFSSEGEVECEKNPGQDDVWRSIQSQKEMQKTAQLDVWGTILNQKSENPASNLLTSPYVHPLVKRSASTLTEKSLEICTESLGSETGSDGFSSYPSSEILSDGDGDEDKEERQRVVQEDIKVANPFEDLHVVKYKNSPVRPFPPPLPSISGGDGVSLHMHSHRKNGRLVLEAIAVPPRKYFCAQRGNGRLVLTLINRLDSQENKVEEFEKVFDNMEEVDASIEEEKADGGGDDDNEVEEEEEELVEEKFKVNNRAKEVEFFMQQNSKSLPNGMISVHKSSLMKKKLMGLGIKNPIWSQKFNKAVNLMEAEEVVAEQEAVEELPIPQSLPTRTPARLILSPPTPPHAAAAFNAYEYFRGSKTTVAGGQINPMITTQQPTPLKNKKVNGEKAYDHQEMALTPLKGNKTVVPYLRGCNKKPRSSLLIWEPNCIATS